MVCLRYCLQCTAQKFTCLVCLQYCLQTRDLRLASDYVVSQGLPVNPQVLF